MAAKKVDQRGGDNNNFILITLSSIIVILAAALAACLLSQRVAIEDAPKSEQLVMDHEVTQLRYWGVSKKKWNELGNARSMDRTFEKLQYKFVNASHGDDWDILWSIEYPFATQDPVDPIFCGVDESKVREDQKVNHFPGIGILISKSEMNERNQHLPYIMPSFVLPDDKDRLKTFLKSNPDVTLLEKNVYNRGVHIVKPKEIIYKFTEVFYQQFMDKPLLIDGHAFDFGVFVLITSFDPVRVYRFNEDVLFRFCKKKYHPFDPEDSEKYAVQEGLQIHPPDQMPSFEKMDKNYPISYVKMFEQLIEERGFNAEEMWTKIDDAIVKTVMNTESRVIKRCKARNLPTHNFFELVRYDFLLDENLNPYIMEVNMSPNLTPAHKRYEGNVLIYEQLIMGAVKMIGFGSYHDFTARFNESDVALANKRNIAVSIEKCLVNDCHQNCDADECRVCPPCVNQWNRFQMREAFREHSYAAHFRRLFPRLEHYYDDELFDSMSENNKVSIEWFKAKCQEDERWC